jgi:glucokinase
MDLGKETFIGIEIGGTKLQLVVADANANIIDRVRFLIDATAGAEGIKKQIGEGTQKLLSKHKVDAIGIGFGGPVEWQTGAIHLSHQVQGWENFNLKTWLHTFSNLPVAIDNDANTAALAEAIHGAGKGFNNVFYITIGSGIGGGFIMNGKIYHGRTPGEVEFGHLRLDKSGATVEERCSGWAVNKKVRAHIEKFPASNLATLAADQSIPEARLLAPALDAKDPDAIAIINQVADDLSFALSHVVHLFNPDIIILGGGLSLLGEHLRSRIIEILPRYIMKALLPAPPIAIAALNEDVVPLGAILLARDAFAYVCKTKTL